MMSRRAATVVALFHQQVRPRNPLPAQLSYDPPATPALPFHLCLLRPLFLASSDTNLVHGLGMFSLPLHMARDFEW